MSLGQQAGAPQPTQSIPGLQAPTGMQGETAAEQPLYLPSEDPIYDVYRNFLKVDKDNAAFLVSDYGSSTGKDGDYYNKGTTHPTLRFLLQISSDTRINYGKSFVMISFVIRGGDNLDGDLVPVSNGINPYASYGVLESASVKFNDFTTSPENYQATNDLAKVIQARLETKYDYNVLNQAHDKLFTPLNKVRVSNRDRIATSNVAIRSERWGTANGYTTTKFLPLGDIFGILDMRGIPNNLTRVEFQFDLFPYDHVSLICDSTEIPPPNGLTRVAVKDMKLLVCANRLSPVQHAESLQRKVNLKSERFAFLYGSSGFKSYTHGSLLPYMGVANLAVCMIRFPSYEVRKAATTADDDTAINWSEYETNGVYRYQFDYGGILFPQKALTFYREKYSMTAYKLAKICFGKEGLTNFTFGNEPLYFNQTGFMMAGKFFDGTYPRITSSSELKISLEGENVPLEFKGAPCNMFYINWVYRTTIVGGDGTVVLQN